VLTTEAFGYLLANKAFQGIIHGITLPSNQGHLINGHFANDSFLTLNEDKKIICQAFTFLDTFCKALGSSIQWKKTSCYRKNL